MSNTLCLDCSQYNSGIHNCSKQSNWEGDIARQLMDCFKQGNKVLIFGNGGSLADASHFAAEFHGIGSVVALNDPAKITSIGNDGDYDQIFSQQVYDLGKNGDIIVGLSSSGNSKNVNIALLLADELGFNTIDFPRQGINTQETQDFQYQLLHKIFMICWERTFT